MYYLARAIAWMIWRSPFPKLRRLPPSLSPTYPQSALPQPRKSHQKLRGNYVFSKHPATNQKLLLPFTSESRSPPAPYTIALGKKFNKQKHLRSHTSGRNRVSAITFAFHRNI
ncbi:hypothetical protein [Microcoleus sp. OTE_8_concoct_300]|uniref:hypothetical protein n=1 Tax=Microcoleus sp. OTE_8_concoct_300 TaxID=2964710 RepID=UPI00403F2E02